MQINTIQSAFGATPNPAPTLAVALPNPSSAGNVVSLYVRFSPLTGTPAVADSYGNRYRLTAANNLSATQAVAFLIAEILRGGANHTITATAQGGPQTLEMGVSELSVLGPTPDNRPPTEMDALLALLVQSAQQTVLLQQSTNLLQNLYNRRY